MTNRRSTQGRPWLAVGLVLGLLAAPGGAAAGAVPRTAAEEVVFSQCLASMGALYL